MTPYPPIAGERFGEPTIGEVDAIVLPVARSRTCAPAEPIEPWARTGVGVLKPQRPVSPEFGGADLHEGISRSGSPVASSRIQSWLPPCSGGDR